jgi:hypothetical protein
LQYAAVVSRAPVLLTLLAATVVCVGGTQAAEPALRDLRSLDDLKTAFNRDRGQARLVLLMSPT